MTLARSSTGHARARSGFRRLREGVLTSFPWELGWLRYQWFTRVGSKRARVHEAPSGATEAIDYSAGYLERYRPDRRVRWTLFLLASIPDCRKGSLLVIGPRYEPELLMARGLGWDPSGIRGLDTFSYSPYVDVGDMHAMPYDDGRFDAVVCGWTLSYSSRPDVAAKEMARVLRPGGYLVVAVQKVPDAYEEVLDGVPRGTERIQTLERFDELYAGLDRVAGFEPDVVPGQEGHTLAAYRKPLT